MRIWSKGVFLKDVAEMIVSNTRAPADAMGDLLAQAEAPRSASANPAAWSDKYGIDTVLAAFEESRTMSSAMRGSRVADSPDGTWSTRRLPRSGSRASARD